MDTLVFLLPVATVIVLFFIILHMQTKIERLVQELTDERNRSEKHSRHIQRSGPKPVEVKKENPGLRLLRGGKNSPNK